jgi:hypothetical protein
LFLNIMMLSAWVSLPPCRYVLSYIEHHVGLKRGEKIWQMGFGSGFKCNSAVWRARKRIRSVSCAIVPTPPAMSWKSCHSGQVSQASFTCIKCQESVLVGVHDLL